MKKYEHLSPKHQEDGSLKSGEINSDTPLIDHSKNDGPNSENSKNKFALGINSKLVMNNTFHCNIATADNFNVDNGPFVDDGAPYSAIGTVELNILQNNSSKRSFIIDVQSSEFS